MSTASPIPLQRDKLTACLGKPAQSTDFSIGHRGAALMFPEHTRASYEAGARMGAGIIECDVTFTRDKQLVCRHAQNDLATTTNILATDPAATCVQPLRECSRTGRRPASVTFYANSMGCNPCA